jgi:SAM-dependent methyltransferase
MNFKQSMKKLIWAVFPLSFRKSMAIGIERQTWLPGRHRWAMTIIRDFCEQDVDGFHRFLWSHHLGYAQLYEEANDFGAENLIGTRRILFSDLTNHLMQLGVRPATDIKSVFEVGCSSGYLLRYMETNLFPSTTVVEGIDIDEYAIQRGQSYLSGQGSKIKLRCADMADLDIVMSEKTYDLILCAGVLMYLKYEAATDVVCSMLRHSNGIVVIAGLAHPIVDNAELKQSEPRSDGALIHNIDKMVEKAGGIIEFRRWGGSQTFDGYSVYFIFCRKGNSTPLTTENKHFVTCQEA